MTTKKAVSCTLMTDFTRPMRATSATIASNPRMTVVWGQGMTSMTGQMLWGRMYSSKR